MVNAVDLIPGITLPYEAFVASLTTAVVRFQRTGILEKVSLYVHIWIGDDLLEGPTSGNVARQKRAILHLKARVSDCHSIERSDGGQSRAVHIGARGRSQSNVAKVEGGTVQGEIHGRAKTVDGTCCIRDIEPSIAKDRTLELVQSIDLRHLDRLQDTVLRDSIPSTKTGVRIGQPEDACAVSVARWKVGRDYLPGSALALERCHSWYADANTTCRNFL